MLSTWRVDVCIDIDMEEIDMEKIDVEVINSEAIDVEPHTLVHQVVRTQFVGTESDGLASQVNEVLGRLPAASHSSAACPGKAVAITPAGRQEEDLNRHQR